MMDFTIKEDCGTIRPVKIEFNDKNLDRLETDPRFTSGLAAPLVSAYRKRIQLIRGIPDERDLYSMKSLRFKKLKGDRTHQHSMRLNDQFRLIVELHGKSKDKVVCIIGIEDYHG